MNPTLNRLLLIGWPIVAGIALPPMLKSLEAPPGLTVAVFAAVAMVGGALVGAYFNVPESWLETEEERNEKRSQRERQQPE